MKYAIRPCERKDMPALVLLCQKHAQYEKANYDPVGKLALLERSILSDQPMAYCWVVEANDQLVGYCSFTFDFSTWDARKFLHLDCLYLDDQYRGLGIGKKIMQQLIAVAIEKNCANVQWQTPAFNADAIAFYKSIGAKQKDKARFTYSL
jgi:ribosomal protein S18 acetylase RimI-like enzyme